MGLPAVSTYARPKSLGLVWARDPHGEWSVCKGCHTVVPETRDVPLPFAERLCSECLTAHRCRCGQVDGHVEETGACADCVAHGEQHADSTHQRAHAPGCF